MQITIKPNASFRIETSAYLCRLGLKNHDGLYTKSDIKKGDYIGTYEGMVLGIYDIKMMHGIKSKESMWKFCQYVFSLEGHGHDYDIYPTKDHLDMARKYEISPMYFINHGKERDRNCEYVYKNKKIYCMATRNIKSGQELLTDYGSYFEKYLLENSRSSVVQPYTTKEVLEKLSHTRVRSEPCVYNGKYLNDWHRLSKLSRTSSKRLRDPKCLPSESYHEH